MSQTNVMIITKTDVDFHPTYFREECDCACPDNGYTFDIQTNGENSRLAKSEVYSDKLNGEYSIYFNPLRETGVIVLNRQAIDLLEKFHSPAIPDKYNIDAINKLQEIGLIEQEDSTIKTYRGSPKTLSVWLHVTNECNLRCNYCYINKSSERMTLTTGLASVDAIIRSATKGSFKRVKIKFAGGEASLNLGLVFELNQYAKRKCLAVNLEYESVLLSNGVAISEKAIEELISQEIRIMISIDGVGSIHDKQRKFINGKGSFKWVNNTLQKLHKYGIVPFISITLTAQNAQNLPETVAFLINKGLPFNINFYRENECTSSQIDLILQCEILIDALKQAFQVIETNLPPYSLLGMLVDRSSFDQPHDKTCGVGESYLVIDQKGQISSCHLEIEKPITSIETQDPLAFIRLHQSGVQNLSVNAKEECKECEWRYWCTGGCPLLTFKSTGRYDLKSPYCQVYKAIYPELLRLEGLRLLKYAKAPVKLSKRIAI